MEGNADVSRDKRKPKITASQVKRSIQRKCNTKIQCKRSNVVIEAIPASKSMLSPELSKTPSKRTTTPKHHAKAVVLSAKLSSHKSSFTPLSEKSTAKKLLSPSFSCYLTYPGMPKKQNVRKTKNSQMPSFLSGAETIGVLKNKKRHQEERSSKKVIAENNIEKDKEEEEKMKGKRKKENYTKRKENRRKRKRKEKLKWEIMKQESLAVRQRKGKVHAQMTQ